MTQQLTIDHPDAATVAASTHPAALQEVTIYSHSTLLYWWPAWVLRLCHCQAGKILPTAEGTAPVCLKAPGHQPLAGATSHFPTIQRILQMPRSVTSC